MRANSPAAARKMEAIAKRGAMATAAEWIGFVGKVIEEIGGPGLATLRAASKSAPAAPTREQCCTPLQYIGKADPPGVSLSLSKAIDALAEQLFSGVWGATDLFSETALQKTLFELMNEALADGYAQAAKSYEALAARDAAWAAANPLPEAPIKPNPDMKWIQKIQDNGLESVKNTIFKRLVPDIKRAIGKATTEGKDIRTISQDLYEKEGKAKLWQWQRLVRTEGHNAVFASNNAEYTDCGAKWVRWSAAVNDCPICAEIQAKNFGYYKTENVPSPPHPNCRCTTTPVFNLPAALQDKPELEV
jgi:hypothetical protein